MGQQGQNIYLTTMNLSSLSIAWTTTNSKKEADFLAHQSIKLRLAICAQVDSPIESFYHWKNQIEQTREFRITFKAFPHNIDTLERFVDENHSYETPEWIVLKETKVSEKYLNWAKDLPR
jgi:periplasmic divalent cation tolerance protein